MYQIWSHMSCTAGPIKDQGSQDCCSCEQPGELAITITSASSQKYLPSVATVVYNDFYSYHNTYTTSRNSHG